MMSIIPELLVDDINKTIEWYQTTLGFTVLTLSPEGGVPTFARLKNGEAEIMLYRRQEFAREIPSFSSLPAGGSFALYLQTANIRTLWKKVGETDSVTTPLHQTDYGTWEFILQDCNGYYLIIGQD